MSYVEHGPRIFLASRHNSGAPLIYGDYVLPKKRLEGRLKLHDSCSDIRAWSPNSLENSRYFRELSEHDSPVGKIVPFNVVIDNIIRLNSQAQNELQTVKKELQKYKSLKLTPKQEEQLQNLDCISKVKELSEGINYTTEFLKNALFNTSKSGPVIQSNSCLSIRIPCEKYLQNSARNVSTIKNQPKQLYSYSLTTFDVDSSLKNYNLIPSCKSTIKSLPIADYNEKASQWIEYIDVALQVEKETRDVEVQIDDQVDKYLNKIITISAMSQTSFTSKSSDESSSTTDLDKSSSQTINYEEHSFECDASCSNSLQDIESLSESDTKIRTESDFDLHNSFHKGIIIQKDSEIIVLKNELCVRDAELEELRDMNKHLEILLKEKEDCIHTQQGNLKMLHEKLFKLDHEHNYKVEVLKQKLYSYEYLIEKLNQDLNKKCESCYSYSQEIEKLQLCVEEITTLRLENNSLLKKLQETEQLAEKVENCSITLEQLNNVLEERDELKRQNYEQNSILADQEEKLNQLLKVIEEQSIIYNEQMETKNMLKVLKAEIHDKNVKISQYEEQLVSIKRAISDFFNDLKYTLNNLEDLNGICEEICSCSTCDLDIGEEANNILYNINIIVSRFQSYKIESQSLLQQIGDLKHCIESNKQQTYLNQILKHVICEDFYLESKTASKSTVEDNVVILNNSNEVEFEDTSNSADNKNLLNEIKSNTEFYEFKEKCHNHIIKLSKTDNVGKIEKEIIEYFMHFIIKLYSLTKKLQRYAEIERPVMIKQTYYFYEILKDTQSAINISQDVTLKKQLISDLYNQHKEEHKKYETYIKQLPSSLFQVQNKINEFIEDILYQLLKEVLHTEEAYLCDEKINQAFKIYLKSCIGRINTVVQGAGDQRIQIVEIIEEQQKKLQKKDVQIAELKEEVSQWLKRKGEGDCLNEEKSENSIAIKEQLLKITTELNKKDALILKLKEQFEVSKSELSIYDKDCNTLKRENKNLENIKNRLLKECQQNKKQLSAKNKQINNLSQQIRELLEIKDSKIAVDSKINEMEKKLIGLRFENSELEKNVIKANITISSKDKTITSLKNNIDKSDNILSQKVAEYENVMEEKRREIIKLEDQNKLLNDKVKDIEHKLKEMNQTIVSLTEQNNKINIIYTMQEDLTKLDKNEKKLKIELNNLRTQLINDQNNNRKLDNNLDTFLHENEILKKNVEYWKNENSELSIRLCNEIMEEKLKNKLYTFSNKIYERLLTLKKQFDLKRDSSNNEFIKKLQDKYIILQDQEKKLTIDNATKESELECGNQKREIKENEIEEVEIQLLNKNIQVEILKNNDVIIEPFNSPEDNLKTRYNVRNLNSEHNENQCEIEIKECEIKRHKETIKHLEQEIADLHAVLKSQMEEYQAKLILMKKNYDSSLNALCERHKANVEVLQKQFEDDIKSEKIFDSENWLLSLNTKELMELHERISLIINSNSNVIHMEEENRCLYDNDIQQQFYTKRNEAEKQFQMLSTIVYKKESMHDQIVPSIFKKENLHLKNQWQFIASGDTQKYPTLQIQDYKLNLGHNVGYFNAEEKSPKLVNKYEKEKQMEKDTTFDQQRWNFINQCSAYHKLSNIDEYIRTLPTN